MSGFQPSLFLRSTALTEVNPAMATFAREMRSESDGDVLGFLHALMVQINEHMTFDEDPTNSGTSAAEAFALKRGVCQDYAHIFIACARSGGVPARFVSGHFLRSDGTTHQQAGHAWAEAYVPDLGWVGFDPANGICTTDAHARVAIGLDYLGAAPVRGTRYGGGTETLTVAVKVEQAGTAGSVAEPVAVVTQIAELVRVGRAKRARHLEGWISVHAMVGHVASLLCLTLTMLLIQPDILEPNIVILAVVVRDVALHVRLPAVAGNAELQEDRTRHVLGEDALDVPHDFLALLLVHLARLRGEQLLDVRVAIL